MKIIDFLWVLWNWTASSQNPNFFPDIAFRSPAFLFLTYDEEGDIDGHGEFIVHGDYDIVLEMHNNLKSRVRVESEAQLLEMLSQFKKGEGVE